VPRSPHSLRADSNGFGECLRKTFAKASKDFQFASAVASFGMLLRDSPYKGDTTYDAVLEIAGSAVGQDKHEYRAGFLEMVRRAKRISKR